MKLPGTVTAALLLLTLCSAELRAQSAFDNLITTYFNVNAGPPASLSPVTGTMGSQLQAFHAACMAGSIADPSSTTHLQAAAST